jgi:hypothetical protein
MKAARMVVVAVIGSAELATMEKGASGMVGISQHENSQASEIGATW